MWSSSLIAGDKYAPFSLIATQTAPILQPLLFSIVQMTSISYPELACPVLASHSAGARGVKPFVGLASTSDEVSARARYNFSTARAVARIIQLGWPWPLKSQITARHWWSSLFTRPERLMSF